MPSKCRQFVNCVLQFWCSGLSNANVSIFVGQHFRYISIEVIPTRPLKMNSVFLWKRSLYIFKKPPLPFPTPSTPKRTITDKNIKIYSTFMRLWLTMSDYVFIMCSIVSYCVIIFVMSHLSDTDFIISYYVVPSPSPNPSRKDSPADPY